MKYTIVIFIFVLFLNSCIKKECQIAGSYYQFEIPATLTPAKDTFQVGDTIEFTSSFSDELYERITDHVYKLENIKFYPETAIYRIDIVGAIEDFAEFEIVLDTIYDYNFFDYSSGARTLVGEFLYDNHAYTLGFKIIPKQRGLFFFRHGLGIGSYGENQEFDGKCSNVKIDGVVKLNDGVDNNIEMLNDSPDSHYNDWILQKPGERFHDFGGYCFYVK